MSAAKRMPVRMITSMPNMMTIFNPLSVIMGLAIGSRPQTSLPINRLRYISIMTLLQNKRIEQNRGVKIAKSLN